MLAGYLVDLFRSLNGSSLTLAQAHMLMRVTEYYRRHGFSATLRRAGQSLSRIVRENRMVLFYYDLLKDSSGCALERLPDGLSIVQQNSQQANDSLEMQRILNFWNPEICRRNFTDRFSQGASLWLVRCHGQLAGYGWLMVGRTLAPHYFALGADDVHLFDFLVFPQFRGQRVNVALVRHILGELAREGRSRAFIEAAEWNKPQLRSLSRTGFQRLGMARKVSVFGSTIVQWSRPMPYIPGLVQPGTQASPTEQVKIAHSWRI